MDGSSAGGELRGSPVTCAPPHVPLSLGTRMIELVGEGGGNCRRSHSVGSPLWPCSPRLLRRSTVGAGAARVAEGTLLILGCTPAARAPTPLTHAPRVHARDNAPLVRGATRPNLGPTRRTRAPLPAPRPVTPTACTGAKRRRTTSCGRRGILTAGRDMSWITWCRSRAVVPTRPATCSGRRWARRRRRTRWSGRGAARHAGIDRPSRVAADRI